MKPLIDGDTEDFFAKIPWAFEKDGKGQFIRIEDENENRMAILYFSDHYPSFEEGKPRNFGGNIFFSAVSFKKNWFCSKDIWWCVYSYPFVQLKCDRMTTFTPSFNQPALRLDAYGGMEVEGVMKNFYSIDNKLYDGIVMGITKEKVIERGYI